MKEIQSNIKCWNDSFTNPHLGYQILIKGQHKATIPMHLHIYQWLWLLTLKIIRFHPLIIRNISARLINIHLATCSLSYSKVHFQICFLWSWPSTSDPQKTNGFILSSCTTCVLCLIKIHSNTCSLFLYWVHKVIFAHFELDLKSIGIIFSSCMLTLIKIHSTVCSMSCSQVYILYLPTVSLTYDLQNQKGLSFHHGWHYCQVWWRTYWFSFFSITRSKCNARTDALMELQKRYKCVARG